MKNGFVARLALAVSVGVGAVFVLTAPNPAAAVPTQAPVAAPEAVTSLVTKAQRRWRGPRGRYYRGPRGAYRGRVYRGPRGVYRGPRAYVRPWRRRPYYGRVVAGVALGTVIVAGAAPRPPASDLCWYWSNSARTHGYWDYCY